MKKNYKIFLTIISVLLLPGLITGCKKLDYNGDENNYNYNVYLYGKWDNDISVLKNEYIIIQVPIYDFNHKIDDDTSISIQNFDDGEIYNIELNNKQEFPEFTSYTLQFNMLFNTTGRFKLDEMCIRDRDGMVKGAKEALKNNIPVGLGTDASCPLVTPYDMWREVYYFAEFYGVSNAFAIHTATLKNAQILGIDDITGSIDVGKQADLIVVKENPLENIKSLRKVNICLLYTSIWIREKSESL